jgi:tetratricopeptide (TPR) repeat protein
MWTIKNRSRSSRRGASNRFNPFNLFNPINGFQTPNLFPFVALALLVAGCRPAGPRALLQGKRLIERGKYPQAVERLTAATTLLVTNAQAWNYLGLACHHAGQAVEAEKAYQRALALNHDLTEAHYNLGCLWLEQNKPEAARTEFIAFTLRRGNAVEGFLKLGAAQWRTTLLHQRTNVHLAARELSAAEKTFHDALLLSPQNPEALNGLGLVQLGRGHVKEAAQYLNAALKQQPGYAPALLNLAIVSHQYSKDLSSALQEYRQYLSLKPPPENQHAVQMLARQLELELHPPAPPAASGAARANTNVNPSAPVQVVGQASRPALRERLALGATDAGETPAAAARSPAPLPEPVALLPKPAAVAPVPKPVPSSAPAPPTNVELVKLPAEPVFKPAQDLPAPHRVVRTSTPDLLIATTSSAAPAQSGPSRYAYISPPKPAPGNHAEAERAFSRGVQAQQAHRLPEAVQAYRSATQLDPSYFDAYYNLGLTATESGDSSAALSAYEHALVIRPDSLDARYNFALLLKQASFLTDAANELERVLAYYPNETRAHLALGNLYAQQLHQPAVARQHYSKVLAADPRHSQAVAIQRWLAQNPP